MRTLDKSYGRRTFEAWKSSQPGDLRDTMASPAEANDNIWDVTSFPMLIECVAFLGSMNKRLSLLYRGQSGDWPLIPSLFRDQWKVFDSEAKLGIAWRREQYWIQLEHIGRRVYEALKQRELGLPRRRGFRDTREIQWAVIQHYGLWPTPLIDVTSSLRVAATFAMDFSRGAPDHTRSGFLYVLGMPNVTGSITFDIDQHTILARLQSCCPPAAKRPHYQEGFLVGHFPLYSVIGVSTAKVDLGQRLVAKFRLSDSGTFWSEEFPILSQAALIPDEDALRVRLVAAFGSESAEGSSRSIAEGL